MLRRAALVGDGGAGLMFSVHMYIDDKLKLKQRMLHIPNVGDTIRHGEGVFAKVTEIVWCIDEPHSDGQRVNIRVEGEE